MKHRTEEDLHAICTRSASLLHTRELRCATCTNCRSPRPARWVSTTIGEQTDAAAALLRGLDLIPAIVFGTSVGQDGKVRK